MASHIIPTHTNISELDCSAAFGGLAQKEALYAYYFAKASWNGAKICFFERSYESPALLYLVLKAFESGAKETVEGIKGKIDQVAIDQILIYLAAFLDNTGNYKSFGDTKFVPECSEENFKKFFLLTPYWSAHEEEFNRIYDRIVKFLFNHETPYGLIDWAEKKGTTGYYSPNVTLADAEKVKAITIKKGLKSENNRLTKQGENSFTLRVASVEAKREIWEEDGIKITIEYGEFGSFLKRVSDNLA